MVVYENDIDLMSIFKVLRRLGDVDTHVVTDHRGKETKFLGKIRSANNSNLGVMYFPWNRALGVNKINLAYRQSETVGLDGTIIISNEFTSAAIEQASRINTSTNQKIMLLEAKEIESFLENMEIA